MSCKPLDEPLDRFIKRKGGINRCASRFTRLLGPSCASGTHTRKNGLKRIMRKGRLQQRQIVIAVDRDSATLDLSVFALPLKGNRTQTVGTATLKMADVPEVVRLLTESLWAEDQLVKAEICHQKVEKVEGKKALGPLSLSRRPVPHALDPIDPVDGSCPQ